MLVTFVDVKSTLLLSSPVSGKSIKLVEAVKYNHVIRLSNWLT